MAGGTSCRALQRRRGRLCADGWPRDGQRPLAGALVLGLIQDFVNLDSQLNDYTQNIVYGVFIVAAVVLQKALLDRQQAIRETRASQGEGTALAGAST